MKELKELKAKLSSFIEQLITLIKDRNFQNIYAFKSKFVEGSSIGQHIRHIYDHFNILVCAVEKSKEVVDYDCRERNTKIETECSEAINHFELLIDRIDSINSAIDQSVKVNFITDSNPVDNLISNSTLGRELWFCTHHAIHHLALIKVIGKEFEYEVDTSLGTAPATANYKNQLREKD